MRWGMQSWDYSQKFVTLPECWQRDFCLAPCNMVLIINPLRILDLTWKILEIISHILCQLVCNWLYMYPHVYSCACAVVQPSQRCFIYISIYTHAHMHVKTTHGGALDSNDYECQYFRCVLSVPLDGEIGDGEQNAVWNSGSRNHVHLDFLLCGIFMKISVF